MTKSNIAQPGMHGNVLDCPFSASQNAPSTLSQDSESRLSFLCLPAEIRNKIYRYSLIKSSLYRIHGLVQPPLTRTNRQIRAEALPVYYGNNQFQIIIPTKPLMNEDESDEWADFVRMFRVFKAGRIAGTGSLQFLRDLACTQSCRRWTASFLYLEVVFKQPATKSCKEKHRGCGAWEERCVQKPKKPRLYKNREFLYRCLGDLFGEAAFGDDRNVMHETCVHRLIDTIVMVATECPDIIKEIHFHADRNWEENGFFVFGSD